MLFQSTSKNNMENSKEIEKRLDKLTDLLQRSLVYSMYKGGHTMDEIAKNMHMSKQTVVNLLTALNKKGKKEE